ncbi:hypothetical protein GCM10027258_58020 [Amycolatopsis stemonae]
MDARDRQLLAGLARVNTEIGRVTVELLTLQPDDAAYADGLRTLGRQLVGIGAQLAARAGELDGREIEPHELLTAAKRPEAPPS